MGLHSLGMKISKLSIENYRCFARNSIEFSDTVNILIGSNNAGKSSILKCLLELQYPSIRSSDIRIQKSHLHIKIEFKEGWIKDENGNLLQGYDSYVFSVTNKNTFDRKLYSEKGSQYGFSKTSDQEPNNLIYPYLAKRKTISFDESINAGLVKSVRADLSNLYSKIDRLADIGHPKHNQYKSACESIIGFYLHCQSSEKGKHGGMLINDFDFIPMHAMGDGISNLAGIICNLCLAEDKIFIIEELENDIHPKALKGLLELIRKSTIENRNQFFISTHSNIVLSYLGADEKSEIFEIKNSFDQKIPTSDIKIRKSLEERIIVLEELGYNLFDFNLWSGWLLLEESSAETIINSFIIPWFFPKLQGKLRTLSTNGCNNLKYRLDKLHDLFLYLHLTPIYKNKTWVIVDNGQSESDELSKIKETYVSKHSWKSENFIQLTHHEFESYFPKVFSKEIAEILSS